MSGAVKLRFCREFAAESRVYREGGDRMYEAQNVLYPIPACGRRKRLQHEATRLCRAETSGEVGGVAILAQLLALVRRSRESHGTRATERRAA